MWYPPTVVVPFVYESQSVTYEDNRARAMWEVFPIDQRAYNEMAGFRNEPPYNVTDGRRFMLIRSLFELVLANNYLELTHPKLLGWFRHLTAEDRALIQQEGGLLQFLMKHPALEVARQLVYVKPKLRGNYAPPPTSMPSDKSRYPKFYGASRCQNCGSSCQFGSKKCSCCGVHVAVSEDKVCVSENEKQLELLPNSVKEELNVLTAQSDVTKHNIDFGDMQSTTNKQRYDDVIPAAHPPSCSKAMCPHARCLSQLWEEVENGEETKHFKDISAQASLSFDMELEMQSQAVRNDYTSNDQWQSNNQLDEHDHSLDQEGTPEYYSFSSMSIDHNTWSDGSQNIEACYNDSVMATKGSTELSYESSDVPISYASAANSANCFSCLSNSFELTEESQHSRYEQQIEEINVESSLKPKSCASGFVDQIIDACGDFRACFTSTCATEIGQILQVKSVATDTNLHAVSHEQDSQTEHMATSDKNTITEVYMSDLDVLTEEFIKLKGMEKELKRLKSRKASQSPGGDHCERVCGCDCAQRVRKAELCLLTLQFVMCQQHCWIRYFTAPLGESSYQGTEALPDCIAETLNTLQKDYHEMRRQILAGTPLDDLKPLSVNSENITTRTNYSPASVFEAHLNSNDCSGSACGNRADEECKGMRVLDTEVCQNAAAALDEAKDDGSERDQVLVFIPKQPGDSTETNSGAVKDHNGSEAWFDAEEELGFQNQDGKIEKQNERSESMNCKMEQKGTDEDESKQSSLLCITCLPSNIAEHEVLLWCEKYKATNVCISTLSNNMRAAIVYLKSPSDAKVAVRDLNGCSLQGHTVQVMQLSGPSSADPKPSDQFHSSSETHKSKTAVDELGTKSVTHSSSHGGPRCSVDRLTNVRDSPTASGTCVPQHYATMGSFDTIMARLSERHPNISRQRTVDALLELRSKHQGFLSGLPLRSIVDMTSELLTQASSPTCI